MRVFLTGGTGQVGRALIAGKPAGMVLLAPTRAELELGDAYAVRESVLAFDADLIINAAAYTAVDRAEIEPEAARAVNVGLVEALMRAVDVGTLDEKPIVHLSTDFVFDGAGSRPYTPDAPTNPLGVYGLTKRDGEMAMHSAPCHLILRTAWVYAARGENFVQTMLRLMRERVEVRVVADQIGTPTHAAGLARAIWGLVPGIAHIGRVAGSPILHWTDAGAASWYDFAVAIQEEALALGLLERAVSIVPIRTEEYPTPARRPAYSVLDKSATWAVTGPARHWRVELRDCLREIAAARVPPDERSA